MHVVYVETVMGANYGPGHGREGAKTSRRTWAKWLSELLGICQLKTTIGFLFFFLPFKEQHFFLLKQAVLLCSLISQMLVPFGCITRNAPLTSTFQLVNSTEP